MGLDMYLSARRYCSGYSDTEAHIQLTPLADKFLPPAEDAQTAITIERNVMYWRKANQIHSWFVTNVQNGTDDCSTYDVSREQLEELRDICVRVRDGTKLKKAKVTNGYTFTATGQKKPILEDGEVMTNPELAKELLPCTKGFFFGSTDYNSWYMRDITDTIEQIEKVLAWVDAEQALSGSKYSHIDFRYHSSW